MTEFLVVLKCTTLATGLCFMPLPGVLNQDGISIAQQCLALPKAENDNKPAGSCTVNIPDDPDSVATVSITGDPNKEYEIFIRVQEDDTDSDSTTFLNI